MKLHVLFSSPIGVSILLDSLRIVGRVLLVALSYGLGLRMIPIAIYRYFWIYIRVVGESMT